MAKSEATLQRSTKKPSSLLDIVGFNQSSDWVEKYLSASKERRVLTGRLKHLTHNQQLTEEQLLWIVNNVDRETLVKASHNIVTKQQAATQNIVESLAVAEISQSSTSFKDFSACKAVKDRQKVIGFVEHLMRKGSSKFDILGHGRSVAIVFTNPALTLEDYDTIYSSDYFNPQYLWFIAPAIIEARQGDESFLFKFYEQLKTVCPPDSENAGGLWAALQASLINESCSHFLLAKSFVDSTKTYRAVRPLVRRHSTHNGAMKMLYVYLYSGEADEKDDTLVAVSRAYLEEVAEVNVNALPDMYVLELTKTIFAVTEKFFAVMDRWQGLNKSCPLRALPRPGVP